MVTSRAVDLQGRRALLAELAIVGVDGGDSAIGMFFGVMLGQMADRLRADRELRLRSASRCTGLPNSRSIRARSAGGTLARLAAPRTTEPLDEALPALLAERGLSLRALALELEVDPGHLSKAVRRLEGKRATRGLLERIANVLGVDPAYFSEYRQHLVVEALESNPKRRDELYDELVARRRRPRRRARS